jgi:hypothetical protein
MTSRLGNRHSAVMSNTVRQPGRRRSGILGIFTPEKSLLLLEWLIAVFFVIAPVIVYSYFVQDQNYLLLAALSAISIIFIHLGSKLEFLDRTIIRGRKFTITPAKYVQVSFVIFTAFCVVTLGTANNIPLFSALAGADVNTLSEQRGEFLKGRTGAWVALSYLSSILTSTFVPYAIVLAYATKSRLRHLYVLIAALYSVSFLVKALFLNIILPLVAYAVESKAVRAKQLVFWLGIIVIVLVLLISLSGYGALGGENGTSAREYLSSSYIPTSSWDFFIYRSLAVPVFSVVDTFHVHQSQLGGVALLGTTSTLIASIVGAERINLERMVSAYQYGGWNDFANSNVIFIADGYVNFGLLGVLCYALVIGVTFRMFRRSDDAAFRSISILYAFLLYSSPLLGMFLSNGYALLFGQALIVRIRAKPGPPQALQGGS